jgi:mono/diheme cytochrome c family protein
MRSWSGFVVRVMLVAAWAAGAIAARAANDDPAIAQGKTLYGEYCASCHGANGKGDGPEAAALAVKPGDLTQIAKGNGGTFPFYDVMLQISGRPPTAQNEDASLPGSTSAHANMKMPSWGKIFAREEGSEGTSLDLQLQTTGKIMLITEYLQSIQAK